MRYIDENGRLVVRSTLLSSLFKQPKEIENKALWLLNGGEEENEKILLGTVAHCLLFEPDEVDKRFFFYEGDRRSKSFKVSSLYHKTKQPVSSKTLNTATEMVSVLKDYLTREAPDKVRKMIFENYDDSDAYFREKEFSVSGEGYSEVIRPDAVCCTKFLDYKTTSLKAVDAAGWREHIMQYNMHLQLGFYYRVLVAAKGYDNIDGAYHLVQSTVPPYTVSLFFFPKSILMDIQIDVKIAMAGLLKLWEERKTVQNILLEPVLNFAEKGMEDLEEKATKNIFYRILNESGNQQNPL